MKRCRADCLLTLSLSLSHLLFPLAANTEQLIAWKVKSNKATSGVVTVKADKADAAMKHCSLGGRDLYCWMR